MSSFFVESLPSGRIMVVNTASAVPSGLLGLANVFKLIKYNYLSNLRRCRPVGRHRQEMSKRLSGNPTPINGKSQHFKLISGKHTSANLRQKRRNTWPENPFVKKQHLPGHALSFKQPVLTFYKRGHNTVGAL